MNYKKTSILLLAFIILLFTYFSYKLVKIDNNDFVPHIKQVSKIDTFHLKPLVESIKEDSLLIQFPYSRYLVSANHDNILLLIRDLGILDSLFPNSKMNNQRVFSNALTDSLLKFRSSTFRQYSPDSLIYQMQWAEKFKYYAELDVEHKPLFISIHDYWINFLANSLSAYTKENTNIKYDFKFRFLKTKCEEKQFTVSPKETHIEKVSYNILSQNWPHLFNASWNQASKIQVAIILFLFLGTLLSYIYSIKFLIKKFFKK